jgi:hypothetical protein
MLSKKVENIIYKTIIMFAVLCGREIWSLTLSKVNRLRMFENMALSRIFGPRRDKVKEGSRKLNNEKRHSLYSSPNINRTVKSRRIREAGHVT